MKILIAMLLLAGQFSFAIDGDEECETRLSEVSLSTPIATMPFSKRTRNCLKSVGILYVGDLIARSEAEIAAIPGCGEKAAAEIRTKLPALSFLHVSK